MEVIKISKTSSIITNLIQLIKENPILNLKVPFTKNYNIPTTFIIESDLETISPAIHEYFNNENFRYYISVKYYKNQVRLDEIKKIIQYSEYNYQDFLYKNCKFMSFQDGVICFINENNKISFTQYTKNLSENFVKIYVCKENNINKGVFGCAPIRNYSKLLIEEKN
jgi:hypothetical protein